MTLKLEATYEQGVLKPAHPLPLAEHERVEIVLLSKRSLADETAGMITWSGDPRDLERVACDPEFSILESP